jgi:hypothetical protein
MNNTQAILEKIDAIRNKTLQQLNEFTQDQLDWRPSGWTGSSVGKNKWSLGEVFMHLAVDEHYLREQIARPLLEGIKPPEDVTFLPPPPPYGLSKQVIRFWLERARKITRQLLENLPGDANLQLKHSGGLEPMDGLEWLEGYGGHEIFHHKQIEGLVVEMKNTSHK